MAGVRDKELLKISGWPGGVNNVAAEHDLQPGELREAVNVDLSPSGKPSTRRGYVMRDAGRYTPELFAARSLGVMLAVKDGNLIARRRDGSSALVREDVGFGPVSFAEYGDQVFWTNGLEIGRIGADLEALPLWLPTPPQPVVSASSAGGLVAGEYQVAITWTEADGRESGSTLAELVTLPAGGGIALSQIPQHPRAVAARVYVTEVDGEELLAAATVPAGITSWVVGTGTRGRPLETQFMEPLPPGSLVRACFGRLFVASGRVLTWSDALHYGLRQAGQNYRPYPDTIDLLEPADNAGLFLATNKPGTDGGRTLFLSGPNPDGWTQRIVHPYGAVPGSARQVPGSLFGVPVARVPYWLASNGVFCYGLPDGRVVPLTENRVHVPAGERAATLLRESNGFRQLIMSVLGGERQRICAVDSITAEIRRHGVTVG